MKIKQIKSTLSVAVVGVLSPLAMVLPASAADSTWTGLDPSDGAFWSSAANWSSGIPGASDTATFPVSSLQQKVSVPKGGGTVDVDKLVFSGEVTGTSSKSYSLTGGTLLIATAIEAIMSGNGGDHSISNNVTLGGDVTFKTTGSNTLTVGSAFSSGSEGKGGGETETVIDLGTNDLTLDASGGTISLIGQVTGSGQIIKRGTSKVDFKIKANSFTGSTKLDSGEFVLSSEAVSAGNLVIDGGTLKGIGTAGTVTLNSGSIAPGNSPGVINTGNLTLTGGSYEVELGGTADGQYDQTNVTGTVDLGSGTTLNLTLFGGYEPAVNDVFTIINNDGSDAVVGTFNGLANGDKVTLGEYTYQINYDAGDGNDVRVLVTGTPSAPDTGVGSLLSSPIVTLVAALAALGIIGGLKYADTRKK